MKGVVVGVLALTTVLAAGCGAKQKTFSYTPPSDGTYAAQPDDPDKALSEQLRSGAVQLSAAGDAIEAALEESKKVRARFKGETREALTEVSEYLDSAGSSVAEAAADPPDEATVKKDFARADDERKQRIATANDAYRDLEQALGTVEALREQMSGLGGLYDLLTLAIDDLGDAIEAMGGSVESERAEAPAAGG